VSESGAQTFLFADLAGFTAMTEAMGDEPAADLAADFSERLEAEAPDFGAEPIKRIGDAVMLRCERAEDGIRFGLHIAHEVGDSHYFPTVRVGMHTGGAIERGGDWFGSTVNTAARVSGEASGTEVLLTEVTREAAGDVSGVEISERGRRALRNVAEPVLLYAAAPEGDRSETGLPIDPVCRMAVDPERAAGTLAHEGAHYFFCSLDCAAKFAASPDRYTGQT
jgi:adenylate cyclase